MQKAKIRFHTPLGAPPSFWCKVANETPATPIIALNDIMECYYKSHFTNSFYELLTHYCLYIHTNIFGLKENIAS
jgi:hypothetical protein